MVPLLCIIRPTNESIRIRDETPRAHLTKVTLLPVVVKVTFLPVVRILDLLNRRGCGVELPGGLVEVTPRAPLNQPPLDLDGSWSLAREDC